MVHLPHCHVPLWWMCKCNLTNITYKHLATMLAEKWEQPYCSAPAWMRCKLLFALLRSSIQCIGGAHSAGGHASLVPRLDGGSGLGTRLVAMHTNRVPSQPTLCWWNQTFHCEHFYFLKKILSYSHVFISLLFTFHFSASKEKNKQKKTNKQKNKNQR